MASATKLTVKKKTSMRSPVSGTVSIDRTTGWHTLTNLEQGIRIVARAGVSRRTRS